MTDEDVLTHEQLHPLLAKKLRSRKCLQRRGDDVGLRPVDRQRAERIAAIAGECGLMGAK